MTFRQGWRCVLALVPVVAGLANCAAAAPPWQRLMSFKRVEADPAKAYLLTEGQGPWMIMAVTFCGEGAEEDAKALAYELRKSYKLPAYTYEMDLDFTQPVVGRGLDPYGAPKRMVYQKAIKRHEIAVLVGDFPTVDDPEAQATLKKLKYAQPDCMALKEGKRVSRTLAVLRLAHQQFLPEGDKKKQLGPMGLAFLTANPLLPDDYYVPKGVDKLVLEMNENIEHSLLECPGKYSIQVAMFTGSLVQTLHPEDVKTPVSRLAEAADKAHRLAVALREKGYEAYEFHDRYASLVTVGSFDSLGTKGPDGRIELDPKIVTLMRVFGPDKTLGPGQSVTSVGKPKALVKDAPFSLQPIPVEVPQRAVSADYEQTAER